MKRASVVREHASAAPYTIDMLYPPPPTRGIPLYTGNSSCTAKAGGRLCQSSATRAGHSVGPGLRGHFVLYHWTDTLGLPGPCVDREHASVNTKNSSRTTKIGRKEGGRLCRSSAAYAGHGVSPGLRGYFVVCLLHQQHPCVNTENSSRGSQNRKKIRGDRDASALL